MTPIHGFSRLHFIGVGGAGMSTLAEVMHGFGFQVSGSDAKESAALAHLRSLGIQVFAGHAAEQVGEVDAVVFSAAVPATNPEMVEALGRKIQIIRRAELLGRLTADHRSLLIAGTHGKSTTTAMLASIYRMADKQPTIIGGAAPRGEDVSAMAGKSAILIAEADEFDRAYLSLHPTVAVITNVDVDHLDCYGTVAALHQSFADFLNRLPTNGLAVLQAEDPVLQGLRPKLTSRSVTFGWSQHADYRAENVSLDGNGNAHFTLFVRGTLAGTLRIQVPGDHNVLNALAAAAVALEEGLTIAQVKQGLAGFAGVKRRLEKLGEIRGVTFYDDYGHHPTEVVASLKALRNLTQGRLFLVFQPHLFSRTAEHVVEFGAAVALADQAWVTRIFPAREKPIPGVEGDRIVAASENATGHIAYLPRWEEEAAFLASQLKVGDLFVTMGAGDINALGPWVMEAFK